MSEEKSKYQLLEERWKGQEERIRKIIESARKKEDWTVHLEGLPFVDEIKPHEGEKCGRDLRAALLVMADLKETNLREADLSGAILMEADLREADLSWADLSGADLSKADLREADIGGANLIGADLTEASLIEAELITAKLGGARLTGANLAESNLRKADLFGTKLMKANLFKADLSKANLSQATFIGANLWRADFVEANLFKADLSQADLRGANLSRANLSRANLSGADLSGTNLENADVIGVKYDRKAKYRGIRVATCYGSPRFKRFAQDQDFIEEFRSAWWRKPIYLLWLILADCGRSLGLWVGWSIAMAVFFAYIYAYHLGPEAFMFAFLEPSFGNALYYSVVTFTTLGFGDVLPKTSGAARWVMAEMIMGYVMLGGLISIFATKLARRS